jgi:Ser/Thr protein kinase RdoA (MazF antagonist)
MKDLLPNRPEFRNAGIYSIAYKPERRHVALIQAHDGTRAIIKAYARGAFDRAKVMATAFSSRGKLRIPRLLGYDDRHRLLALEWLPGRLLQSALVADKPDRDAVAIAGAALAVLHDQSPYRLPAPARRKEEEALRGTAEVVRYLCPDRGEFAKLLAKGLAERLNDSEPEPRALHGNFQPRHVLLTESGVALIDFDLAMRGNPACDIGSFLASLELATISGEMRDTTAATLRTAFMDGYQTTTRRVSPSWIEVYTALHLFHQVLQPFRARTPEWPQRIAAILARCAVLLRWPTRGTSTHVELHREDDTAVDVPNPHKR